MIDLSRLRFLLRIRPIPLAAPHHALLRLVLPEMSQDYVLHPGVLRGQDYGIQFMRSSKAGQRNGEKYAKYSKAATTRQYFALGGSAADWRYDLQHRYVRFTDADLQQRTNSLLELRIVGQVFRNLDSDDVSLNSPPLDTPVSGGDKPSCHALPHRLCIISTTSSLSRSLQS